MDFRNPIRQINRSALKVALAYGVVGALWILFSDQALEAFVKDPSRWQTIKGWAYVTVTALLVYFMVRRQTEKLLDAALRLQTREAETREIFDAANSAILVVHPESGAILDANQTTEKLFDQPMASVLTMTLGDLVSGPGVPSAALLNRQVREFNQQETGFEWQAKPRHGEAFHLDFVLKQIHVSGQARVLAVIKDITDRKRMDLEKSRLEEQLRQSQKMEAIGQLAGGVAHDFNNLLQVINGHTDLMLEDADKDWPFYESLKQIEIAGTRAAELVRQLLTYSRRQIINPVSLDLNDQIAHMKQMLSRLIGEQIEIRFSPNNPLEPVYGDPGMIDQVIMNLCLNARDAMSAGGVLTIRTQNLLVDENSEKNHAGVRFGRYVLLTIEDTGVGMGPETLARIFEPFFTTKGIGQGTGLGLATAHGIIQQHNGAIRATSEPERGTTFHVYLPTKEQDQLDHEEGPRTQGGQETILLAEDNLMARHLARHVLTQAGYTVVTAGTGQEVVDLFEKNPEQFHLLLLDVMMPETGGRDVWLHIQSLRPGMPVLFISSDAPNANHCQFILNEGLDLIAKPFSPEALLWATRNALNSRSSATSSRPSPSNCPGTPGRLRSEPDRK